ncbi:hypothetical protein POM88_015932 [Heracleum sosnowskyi]|uniref:Helitron helicase-like domain-containing protein n=1 Tax=Heracleum sosnowskyi TaxID=360622 RepID=A0AAD8MWN2_9APIA|nr:hypothetical protein POM88_015932 [Heracleum sosnowskyi]
MKGPGEENKTNQSTPNFNDPCISTPNYTNETRNKGKKAIVSEESDGSDLFSHNDFYDDGDDEFYEFQKNGGIGSKVNKGKQPLDIPPRTLDFNENERQENTSDYHPDIDMLSDQSDGDSEDEELQHDVDDEAYDMLKTADNVVKEYATLGPPSVQCNKCHAWMWKEEHVDDKSGKKREFISMKEYYSYKFQFRTDEAITPCLGGRLYQQYIFDVFSTIEQARLWWFRTNQSTLRSELYTNIQQSLIEGTSDTSNLGKGFILPAGFVGSRRYMQQNFQDAFDVCRYIGHPDIFITMTTNPVWDEVIQMMKLLPQCSPQNSPNIMAHVFRLKLDQLIDDTKKKHYFGTCLGVMYVVEFQK